MPFSSHDEYFDAQSAEVRGRLEQIRKEVETRVPGARRTISHNMQAFQLERTFFCLPAFKKHIGVYPPVTRDLALIEETESYRGPKGNLSFSHGEELPLPLIGRVASALALQYTAT